jgi:F0F1-type ATP synthase epsilon subunit
MSLLSLTVVDPTGVQYKDEVSIVRAQTPAGEIEILPGHCPYIGLVAQGGLQVVPNSSGSTISIEIGEGSILCEDNKVFVLSERRTAAS